MRSPFPPRRAAELLAAGALLLAAGCGGDAAAGERPDRVVAGPQGAVGQFVVECGFSHHASDDPIVAPGRPGASHLHQFFGAADVHAGSTYDELVAGATTCDHRADTASYWAPVLIDVEQHPIVPVRSVAYYRAGPDVDPAAVEPYPADLAMIAGDAGALEPQPIEVVSWSCGAGSERHPAPPACGPSTTLRMTVTFPDCWDGEHARSPEPGDFSAHVAYSTAGRCADSHPVHIPQLQFAIDYPPVAADELAGLALSSGAITTGHADFWNAWDQDALAREVTRCIGRDLVCGVSG